jgi:hypothetical protein
MHAQPRQVSNRRSIFKCHARHTIEESVFRALPKKRRPNSGQKKKKKRTEYTEYYFSIVLFVTVERGNRIAVV